MLPELVFDTYSLNGKVTLNAWNDFYVRETQLEYQSGIGSTDTFELRFELPEEKHDPLEPSKQQVNAYRYLIANCIELETTILNSLLLEYKKIQVIYDYESEEMEILMPDVNSIEEFKSMILLQRIHIWNESKDEISFIGYEFYCMWDEEHGLGVLTHYNNIVEIGFAEVSFD